MLNYKIDFDKLDWENPLDGVRSKTCRHAGRQMRLIEYTEEMPPHWCEKGHAGMILDGELEIEFADDKILFKKGDGIFIPDGPQHKHKGRVITKSVKVIFLEDV